MTKNLSPAAESIVLALSSSRQGTTPKRGETAALAELQVAGVLGPDYGLTRSGGMFRDRLVDARMDAAF